MNKYQTSLLLSSIIVVLFILISALVGCSLSSMLAPDIGAGSSKEEVIALLGEPDQTRDLVLPEAPFFGPQESLINLVPAGTLIEEWVYEVGDDVLLVWFTGGVDEAREDWRVLDTAQHPKDAVY
jgi:hypothetical protein